MDFSRNFLTAPVRPHRGGLLFCRCPRERPVLSWRPLRRKQAPADGAQQAGPLPPAGGAPASRETYREDAAAPLPERRGQSAHWSVTLCQNPPKQAAAQKWHKHKKHRSIVTLSGVLPISSPAIWSEWRESNSRPLEPHSSALPNCATPGYAGGLAISMVYYSSRSAACQAVFF